MGLLGMIADAIPDSVKETVADVGGGIFDTVVDTVVPAPLQDLGHAMIGDGSEKTEGSRSGLETIGTLVSDGAGLIGDLGHSVPYVGAIGDFVSGTSKLAEDDKGERNWGGLGDLAGGALGLVKDLGHWTDAGESQLGQVAGAFELVTNGYEAVTNLDKAESKDWSEAKDFWGAAGDAGIGALKMIPGLGKVVGAGETVLDGAGAIAGAIDKDYKFGAGDALGFGMFSDGQATQQNDIGLEMQADVLAQAALGPVLSGIPGASAVAHAGVDGVKSVVSGALDWLAE